MNDSVFAVAALEVEPRVPTPNFPREIVDRLGDRQKRPLGELFGLKNFGVNLTRVGPGAATAFLHSHSRQDEFVYVLQGTPTLRFESDEMKLEPGMCVGFPAGGPAHQLVNESQADVLLLEIGDRGAGDEVRYPTEDLISFMDERGVRHFVHRDGSPYGVKGGGK